MTTVSVLSKEAAEECRLHGSLGGGGGGGGDGGGGILQSVGGGFKGLRDGPAELHRPGLDVWVGGALHTQGLGLLGGLVGSLDIDGGDGGGGGGDGGGGGGGGGVEVHKAGGRGSGWGGDCYLLLEGVIVEVVGEELVGGGSGEDAGDGATNDFLQDQHGDEANHGAAAVGALGVDGPGLAGLERLGVRLVVVGVLHVGHEAGQGNEARGESDGTHVLGELGGERGAGGELGTEASDKGDLCDAAVDGLGSPAGEAHGVLEGREHVGLGGGLHLGDR
mmetsp:Transcript_36624/g.91252  ORF Transcript_36624/g.91252 Transcript_36624/m.91252 type:complete len:277 (+) Transcript_36624:176-1006(+)